MWYGDTYNFKHAFSLLQGRAIKTTSAQHSCTKGFLTKAGPGKSLVEGKSNINGRNSLSTRARAVEFAMEHADQKSIAYRRALRLFVSAFAECDRLTEPEQRSLLHAMGAQLLQRMPQSTTTAEPANEVKITGITVKAEKPSS